VLPTHFREHSSINCEGLKITKQDMKYMTKKFMLLCEVLTKMLCRMSLNNKVTICSGKMLISFDPKSCCFSFYNGSQTYMLLSSPRMIALALNLTSSSSSLLCIPPQINCQIYDFSFAQYLDMNSFYRTLKKKQTKILFN
jgi:hypothetical protein